MGAVAYLQVSPLGGSRDDTWRGHGIRKRCVLEFAKTESVVTVQRWFRTMYHTESRMDKTIREWYVKFQQSGCLCAAKRTGRLGPSDEIVECARETVVRSPQRVDKSSTCKVGQKLGVSLPLLACSAPAWLLYRKGRKSRRDL